jgi:hypothetical protein
MLALSKSSPKVVGSSPAERNDRTYLRLLHEVFFFCYDISRAIMRMRLRLTPMTWFVILTLVTIGLALGLPSDPQAIARLHTSEVAYRFAVAAVLIPYVLIWYTSFYAFAKLQEYSRLIKGTKDGAAFHKIAVGMGVLAFSLVVPTMLSLTINSIAAHNPSLKPAAVIIHNYMGLFPGMVAFLLLCNGSRMLLHTTKEGVSKLDIRWHAPWFLLLSVAFSHLAIENFYRGNPYHLTLWLLVVSFIVPFLYGWMVGLLSAYHLYWYAKTVKGMLYRQAVRWFAYGIIVTVFASIAIQFINVTLGQRIDQSLSSLLLAEYVLLIIVAAGLILMALGTKKLKRIEES